MISPCRGQPTSRVCGRVTRHEIDLPLELGPTKIVPYVLGEAAFWGEDLNGDSFSRFYGQTGVRASLPMWRADPTVQSELFNLNGLAHKMVFEVEAFYRRRPIRT